MRITLDNFLIHAFYLQEQDRSDQISWKDVLDQKLSQKNYWLHFDGNDDSVQQWLKHNSAIDPHITEIMLSKKARARFLMGDNGFLVVLKAINQNPQGSPEDMVSIRIYVEKDRIITICRKNILLLAILTKKLIQDHTSISSFEMLIQIANELFSNLEDVIESLDDQFDKMDEILNRSDELNANLVPSLSEIRSQTIVIKSYITPQKEVFHSLINISVDWFEKKTKNLFLNFSEKISLYLESLELIKERAVVLLDEIRIRNAEKTNRNSYIFSAVAILFLPLGFLTGLFGINLAGIPGAEHPWAFSVFCLATLFISINFYLFLKKIKWL